MKKITSFLIILITSLFSFSSTQAYTFTGPDEKVYICDGDECGLDKGIDLIKNSGIDGLESEGTASEFIQQIVIYLLTFISLIAVIYIIYAGFRIMTSAGDEEALKKSKTTILYVIIGILIIWFAWAITKFALGIGNAGEGFDSRDSSNTNGTQACEQIYSQNQCDKQTLGTCNWNIASGVCESSI